MDISNFAALRRWENHCQTDATIFFCDGLKIVKNITSLTLIM